MAASNGLIGGGRISSGAVPLTGPRFVLMSLPFRDFVPNPLAFGPNTRTVPTERAAKAIFGRAANRPQGRTAPSQRSKDPDRTLASPVAPEGIEPTGSNALADLPSLHDDQVLRGTFGPTQPRPLRRTLRDIDQTRGGGT
jgi:hypothetical protein